MKYRVDAGSKVRDYDTIAQALHAAKLEIWIPYYVTESDIAKSIMESGKHSFHYGFNPVEIRQVNQ